MDKAQGGARKIPPFVIVSALVLVLAGMAYWAHQSAVAHTVETLYGQIFAAAPARSESYPTEVERFERCQRLLAVWRSLDSSTIDLEQMQVALPFPLRITRTLVVNNPEDLRKRAGVVFARDLTALSGRKPATETLSGWQPEIEAWRAALGR